MEFSFKDLFIGDMFNTKDSRWVKVAGDKAIVVLSTLRKIGDISRFYPDDDSMIVLYSKLIQEDICYSGIMKMKG